MTYFTGDSIFAYWSGGWVYVVQDRPKNSNLPVDIVLSSSRPVGNTFAQLGNRHGCFLLDVLHKIARRIRRCHFFVLDVAPLHSSSASIRKGKIPSVYPAGCRRYVAYGSLGQILSKYFGGRKIVFPIMDQRVASKMHRILEHRENHVPGAFSGQRQRYRASAGGQRRFPNRRITFAIE